MNLLDIRKQFIGISGRYDLVEDTIDWVDKGANFYINSGKKLLDKLCTVPENTANLYYELAAGEYSQSFQFNCRAIKSVFVNSSSTRYQLEKITLNEMKSWYTNPVADITSGAPLYYCLANLRALETTDQNSLGTYLNLTHTESDTKYDYRGIILAPVLDEAYVIEISGLFDQFELTNNTDENYWTLADPALLLKAALYHLESFSRGTENAKNWISAIRAEAMEHDKDSIEECIADIDMMEG